MFDYFYFIFFSIVLIVIGVGFILFYPTQIMSLGELIDIETPEPQKYRNDCLHPCVRYIEEGFASAKWWMIQSPYYNRNNKIENPILYYSNENDVPQNWIFTKIIQDTPETGFNSDPNIYYESGKLWIFWRECDTPRCRLNNTFRLTVGVYTEDGQIFSDPQIYLKHEGQIDDFEQCPILVKINNKYLFYAVNFQYSPKRKSKGLVVWEGESLESPDFEIKEFITLPTIYTCDKLKQFRINRKLFFIPWFKKHNVWHFDLYLYNSKLYMASVDEWGDNIMLSVSNDFKNFKYTSRPLINNHFIESKLNYRTYFYKPTFGIFENIFYLYYTETDNKSNKLKYSSIEIDKL